MAVWAKWARYSITHNFLNICDRNSIFVSLPMFSGLRKPVLTLILQLKNLFFFEVAALQLICLSLIRPNTHLIIWMSFLHGIGEHYLKWNHNSQPDKVIKSQNCDVDDFCTAQGTYPPGSNWPHMVLWELIHLLMPPIKLLRTFFNFYADLDIICLLFS